MNSLLKISCFIVGLLYSGNIVSQVLTTKIDLGTGPIKQLHISHADNKWVLTTDTQIILWDNQTKKVDWMVEHNTNVYNAQQERSYPSKAVISGKNIYQVNSDKNQLEVRNVLDGKPKTTISFPTTNGTVTGLNNIVDISATPNKFLILTTMDNRLDSTFKFENEHFLLKGLVAEFVSQTPNGKYLQAREQVIWHDKNTPFYKTFAFDESGFLTAKRPLSRRYQEHLTRGGVIAAAQDGKHIYRAWYSKMHNWEPVYEVEKLFGLTKKVVSTFQVPLEPKLMEHFGNSNQLIMYTEKELESSWFQINTETWEKSQLDININPTQLFNDPKKNQLVIADRSGSLWILESENTAGEVLIYNATGAAETLTPQALTATTLQAKSIADQQEVIQAIKNDNTDPLEDPDYWANKSFEYSQQNMYEAAEASQMKLYNAYSDQYGYVAYTAWYKLLNGKPQEAQQLAKTAHEMLGFDPLAPTIASYAYASLGDLSNAKKYMKTACSNTLSNQDFTELDSDIKILRGVGYSAENFNSLNAYYKTLYQHDLNERAANMKRFQDAQKLTGINAKLAGLETVIASENSLAAPRTELLGAAYSEIANVYRNKGNVNKAKDYSTKAVDLLRPYGKLVLLTGALVNAGHAQNEGNQMDLAVKYYNEALELITAYGGDLEIYKNGALNGLGGTYSTLNDFSRAIPYFEEALEDARKTGRKNDEAIAKGNIASTYIKQGQRVTQAINLLKQAEGTFKSMDDQEALARNHNNLGWGYMLLGQWSDAVTAFKEADRIFGELGMNSSLANVNKNIGKMLLMLNRKIDAIAYYKKAANYVDETKDPSMAMSIYANLAGAQLGQEAYAEAARLAEKSILLAEQLMQDASGKTKRALLSTANNNYRILSLSQHRLRQYNKAFQAHERNRSRVMLAKLGGGEALDATQVQSSLQPNQALIDFNVVHLHWETNSHFFPIVITNSNIEGKEFSDSTLVYDLKQEGEATFSAYMKNERSMLAQIREFVEEKGVPDNVAQSLVRDANLEKTIEFYRHLMKKPTTPNEVLRKSYAKVFYKLLIGNIEAQLKGKDELIIIPDGPLAFLPFETLMDENGQYLVEKYKVRYIQSATILDKLNERKYNESRKPILAFGGPVFEEMNASEVSRYRGTSGQVDFTELQRSYYAAEANSASMRPTYIKMGFTKMNPLPGTIYETNQIKSIVPGTDLYQNDRASESQFKSLASANALKNYKVLHFATHGWAYAEIPELSTIVLGQYATQKGTEDGYLRVPEIEKLQLNADFVNLSACETALGRLYSSEGVVGLTQAFLVAGANGISVTQWTVSDEGTAIFMSETYRKVFDEDKSFLTAISETKREFIAGKYGQKFIHPDYWGPFVYYGI